MMPCYTFEAQSEVADFYKMSLEAVIWIWSGQNNGMRNVNQRQWGSLTQEFNLFILYLGHICSFPWQVWYDFDRNFMMNKVVNSTKSYGFRTFRFVCLNTLRNKLVEPFLSRSVPFLDISLRDRCNDCCLHVYNKLLG